jgi:glucose-1-phosphate cytidylyltransferase
MVTIGGRPILWHIMKIYSHHGINEFVVCLGYMGYVVKEYFANYFLHMSDVTFDMAKNQMEVHQANAEAWRVTLLDTGESSMTGGRIKRAAAFIGDDTFCLTYGDGVSDVDIGASIVHHQAEARLATLTAVRPPGRFGAVELDGNRISAFREKPEGSEAWINGGFFVLSPKVIDYIDDDATVWERAPMEQLAREDQLTAYRHPGFWQPMDTMRDKQQLEALWASGKAPWKVWE